MKKILNQGGMTFVQIMIVAAILAGTSLVATKVITDQKLAQKSAETRDQVEDLHLVIYSLLQNRGHCRQTILNNTLQAALHYTTGTPNTPLAVASIFTMGSTTLQPTITTGVAYSNNNVIVKSMRLLNRYPAEGSRNFEIVYTRRQESAGQVTKKGYGSTDIKKLVKMRIQSDPNDGSFIGCYAVELTKSAAVGATTSTETGTDISRQLCENMNSGTGTKALVWDDQRSFCRFVAACPTNQLYVGIDSTGSVICKDLEEHFDFNEVLDPSPPAYCPPGAFVRLSINTATQIVSIVCTDNVCGTQNMAWGACTATATAGGYGAVRALSDSTGRYTGTATTTCDTTTGNWTTPTSAVCNAMW